jgi:hypothetical protein
MQNMIKNNDYHGLNLADQFRLKTMSKKDIEHCVKIILTEIQRQNMMEMY